MSRFVADLYFYKDIIDDEDKMYIGQLVYDNSDMPRARFNIGRDVSINTIEKYCPDICGDIAILVPIEIVHEAIQCASVKDCKDLIRPYVNNFRFEIKEDQE